MRDRASVPGIIVGVSPTHAAAIAAAGMAAGLMNTVVGSGSLVTFPTLLALGYPPVLANVSNNIGLVPGGVSGVFAYRRELVGQRDRLVRLVPASVLGGITGAVLLLRLPSSVFDAVVPILILVALVLVLAGPRLSRRLDKRRGATGELAVGAPLALAVMGAGIYGGYFGAAQGVILMALLSTLLRDELQRLNGTKNVLGSCVNASAALIFVLTTEVDWAIVGILAVASAIGGQLGGKIGRRLDPRALRGLIVVIGVAAIVKLVLD